MDRLTIAAGAIACAILTLVFVAVPELRDIVRELRNVAAELNRGRAAVRELHDALKPRRRIAPEMRASTQDAFEARVVFDNDINDVAAQSFTVAEADRREMERRRRARELAEEAPGQPVERSARAVSRGEPLEVEEEDENPMEGREPIGIGEKEVEPPQRLNRRVVYEEDQEDGV